MGATTAVSGLDLTKGIRSSEVSEREPLLGHVGDEPVLVCRVGAEIFAVGATCTHYSASLAEGLIDGETIRCPHHHACFSLRTGAAVRAPAFAPLSRWRVEHSGPFLFVREKEEAVAEPRTAPLPEELRSVVIVGGGAAGFACAVELRKRGYGGAVLLVSQDRDPPYDRPNLSKDYLAGTAPEEWIPLRDRSFYEDSSIGLRLGTKVTSVDTGAGTVSTAAGENIAFDRLLLATGAIAQTLSGPGLESEKVFTLRSLADARAVIRRAHRGSRAAVVGSSFIGLEAAAALRARGVEVQVVTTDVLPFGRLLGRDVGLFLHRLYERNGVSFHLSSSVQAYDGRTLTLDGGKTIEADFILVGIGVRPETSLPVRGLATADGILVDKYLSTGIPGIFAAGDVATYPDPLTGRPTRVEHWVAAQRQGQCVAANMLGEATTFDAVPFFWTEHFGTVIRYVGSSRLWDEVKIEGDLEAGRFIARFYEKGQFRASAACGRDRDSLEDERQLEAAIANRLH